MKPNKNNGSTLQTIQFKARSISNSAPTSRLITVSQNKIDQSHYYNDFCMSDTVDFDNKYKLSPLERLKRIKAKMNSNRNTPRRDQSFEVKAFTIDLLDQPNQEQIQKTIFGREDRQHQQQKRTISTALEKNKLGYNIKSKSMTIKHKRQKQIYKIVDNIIYGERAKARMPLMVQKTLTQFNLTMNSNQNSRSKKATVSPSILEQKYFRDDRINNILQNSATAVKQPPPSAQRYRKKNRRIVTGNLLKRPQTSGLDVEEQIRPWESKILEQQSPM